MSDFCDIAYADLRDGLTRGIDAAAVGVDVSVYEDKLDAELDAPLQAARPRQRTQRPAAAAPAARSRNVNAVMGAFGLARNK